MRKLQFVADWLDLREAQREDRKLRAWYEAEAKKWNEPPYEDGGLLSAEFTRRYDEIWDPVSVRRSQKLIALAQKYGVRIPPSPTDPDFQTKWVSSPHLGTYYLSYEEENRLKREITVEKRQRDDELRKWATLLISVLAFILALVSLTRKPDPCPTNYYRSDSGACVFALQKATPSQPQQGSLSGPPVHAAKPSPFRP